MVKSHGFPSIKELSQIDSWLELGAALMIAVSRPDVYGLTTAPEVLRAVARHRGRKPETLGKILAAASLMQEHFPEIYAGKTTELSQNDVHRFAALLNKFGERSDKIAEEALEHIRDKLTFRSFMDGLERQSKTESGSARTREGHSAFVKRVANTLGKSLPQLFSGQEASLRGGGKVRPECDLVIEIRGENTVAIDCRQARIGINEKLALQIVGLFGLRQRTGLEQWLILDAAWEPEVPMIESLLLEFDVGVARIGCIDRGTDRLSWTYVGEKDDRSKVS